VSSDRVDPHQFTRTRLAVLWAVWWAALLVGWLLLVDTFDPEELVVGTVGAFLGATVAVAVHRRGYIRFWPRAAWLAHMPSLAWSVVVDCWLLAEALWRKVVLRQQVAGTTIRVPFHYGGDNGRDGARRALVNASVSLTPNTFVIDIDPEADSLLVHQLVPRPLDQVLERQRRLAQHSREVLGSSAAVAGSNRAADPSGLADPNLDRGDDR
jgi:multisubunit Na+/H+ antiporter MnhE subunit